MPKSGMEKSTVSWEKKYEFQNHNDNFFYLKDYPLWICFSKAVYLTHLQQCSVKKDLIFDQTVDFASLQCAFLSPFSKAITDQKNILVL